MKQEQENYSENEAYWNKRSEIFDTQILTTYEEAYRKTIDYTKKYLKDSDKALDIGCGTGVTTIELAGSVAEMTAVDTAPEMLRQAREKAKKAEAGNIDFIQGDMFMEELKPGTYDAVMIFKYAGSGCGNEATAGACKAGRLHFCGSRLPETQLYKGSFA